MKIRNLTIPIIGVLYILFVVGVAYANGETAACDAKGCAWLATGTISKVDGTTFYMLGKDNVVYTINSQNAELIVESYTKDGYKLRVGDTIRVCGCVVDGKTINAKRMRVFKDNSYEGQPASAKDLKPEVKIVIEKGTSAEGQPASATESTSCSWEIAGLITEIDYTGSKIRIRATDGEYSINAWQTVISNGNKRIGLGRLNIGDAIQIRGNIVGLREVNAQSVRVLRTKAEADSALPQAPVSVPGSIYNIDYSSMTFSMYTGAGSIAVMASRDTVVQNEKRITTFAELKPGMRVKMTGYGSLMTGFAAQHIQIISSSQ